MYKYTLSLDSQACTLANAGGKGHNLAILSRDGSSLQVPPGFVVTVDAYRDFVAARNDRLRKEMETALSNLKNSSNNEDNNNNNNDKENILDEVSETIRSAFRKRKVSSALRQEIKDRLNDLLLPSFMYVAVRSSATCEDMPDASFAGQHDTYLNVLASDVDNVCRNVVDCFSSLFTSRAISYRERNGLDHMEAGMAVVVQAMVSADSSGVLFTANPLTGRRTESVLEAIPGLGEALVSGLTEPDRYVVARQSTDTDGPPGTTAKILDTRIGAKLKAIHSVEGGGVKEVTYEKASLDGGEEAETLKTVLTDETVLELVELGQKVESLFNGNPQDIEWARSGDTTYVVQSRPITTLFPQPKPIPSSSDPLNVFISFGAIQGITGPLYPAGQDALRSILGRGLLNWATCGRKGTGNGFYQIIAERFYVNVTPVLRNSIGRRLWTKLLSAIEPGIKAGVDEVIQDPRLDVDSGMTPFFFFRLLSIMSVVVPRYVLTIMFPDSSRQRMIDMMEKHVSQVKKNAEGASNLLEVIELKDKTLTTFFPSVISRFVPRMGAAMSPLYLLTRLASSIPDGKDLVLTITRGLPHNVTTEMDLKLWEVAKTIRKDTMSLELFRTNDADSLAVDYLGGRLPGPAQDVIRQFLAEYGMRGLCEIDFGRPRWREEPAPLMQTLKSYVEIDEQHAPDIVFQKGEVAAANAVERLGQELGKPWLVAFLARRIRAIAGLRELPKFTAIRIMGTLRQKMLDEGNKLVQAGTLDAARDVFLLHEDELKAIASDEPRDWRAIVTDRKAIMDRESERSHIPRVVMSDGFGFYGGAASSATSAEGDNVLLGEPVSPGTTEGRVRVVLDPSKTKLEPQEVLVCHGTDPSWTPLFLAASALVMEVGGLMTHGSVVAREYGIPAVVGLEKVTERLKTGQLIRVDGSSGIIEILEG